MFHSVISTNDGMMITCTGPAIRFGRGVIVFTLVMLRVGVKGAVGLNFDGRLLSEDGGLLLFPNPGHRVISSNK